MAKRLFKGIVLFFALYAFAFVPLGKRTALEHVRAIVLSPEAKEAATELQGGAKRLVHKLRGASAAPEQAPEKHGSMLRRDEPR